MPRCRLSRLCIWKGFSSRRPQTCTQVLGTSPEIKVQSTGPPPKASKNTLKPCYFTAALQDYCHSPVVTITCSAPSFLSSSACSCFLTMFSRGILRVWQRLLSILPRAEAAAVWISPLLSLNLWQMSSMARQVKGLTMPEAAEARGTSSSISKALSGDVMEYQAHEPEPVVKDTLLPTQFCRCQPLASTTFPVPSRPMTAGSSNGRQLALDINRQRSEGLTVEPSTLTSSQPAPGLGLGKSLRTGILPNSSKTSAF